MPNSQANTSTASILVFDSGVGGLSVLNELQKTLPTVQCHFACDNAEFPYGTKTEAELIHRVDFVLHALINKIQPDLVVVACNSASTVVLPHIRANFTLPVVGVVPAIKPAAQSSKSNVIGLLATPGTVQRDYTQTLISQFASDCEVIRVGSNELVQIAEDKLAGKAISKDQLNTIISPLLENTDLDTVVLACTHFPLLKEELSACVARPIQWVDSGAAIARRVQDLLQDFLQEKPTVANSITKPEGTAYFTKAHPGIAQLRTSLQKYRLINESVFYL